MTHPILNTEEARQGQRKQGMTTVLWISIALAVIAIGIAGVVVSAG